ncbi:MAG: hypothetical protein ACREC5_07435 [Thermoplasmata archaeon]
MAGAGASSKLPLGVAVLAILIGVVGLLYVISGLLLILGFAALFGFTLSAGLVGGLVALVVGIVLLVVASGLWDLELWALALAVLVLLFLLAENAFRIFTGAGGSSLALLIEVVLLIYLIAVSSHFT